MALIEIKTNPSQRELTFFGAFFPLFFGVLGAVFYDGGESVGLAQALWAVAGVFASLFWIAPPLRKPLYLGWVYLTYPIGWTISHLLMFVVYYGVFTPVGLLQRIVGRDALQRKFDPDAKSYWVSHAQQVKPGRYFQQF